MKKKETPVDVNTMTFEEIYNITHVALIGACYSIKCDDCSIKDNCPQLRNYGEKDIDGCVAAHKTHAVLVIEEILRKGKSNDDV